MPKKGYKMTERHKKKLSVALKGNGIGIKRKKLSKETRDKMSESKKGSKHSLETKRKMSESKIGKKRPSLSMENHYRWKGAKAGKNPIHRWVEKVKGKPMKCEHCGDTEKGKYAWANIDHKYRRDMEDYIRLCYKCHKKYDKENN